MNLTIRRGRRARYALGAAGLLVAVIVIAARSGSGDPAQRMLQAGPAEMFRAAALGPVPEDALFSVEELSLRRGQTVEGALLASGMDRSRVTEVLEGLASCVDLRRIRPEDRFMLYRSRQGDLRRLEYQRSVEERVVVERGPEAFAAHVERAPVQVRVRKIAGDVNDNLYLSLTRAGGDPGLVVEFADLFSWDFDFFTDTRNGDRFEMLVEERTVGGERAGYGRILAGRYLPRDTDEPLEAIHYAWGAEPDESGYYLPSGRSVQKFFLKSPLNYRRISSTFSRNRMHPILKRVRPHLGVDYAAAAGTPVVALGNGRVVQVGWRGGFGRTVKVRHNGTYSTQYAHLRGYAKGIRNGVRVKQGQVIGYVGSSGMATGPHLDFRVQENGRWINPLTLKGGESEPLPARLRPGFEEVVERAHRMFQVLAPGDALPIEPGAGPGPVLASVRLDTPSAS